MYKTNLNDAIAVGNMLYNFKDEIMKLGDKNPERQIQLCKAGLGVNPKDIEFLMLIGRVYARHYNDDTTALYYLEKANRLDRNRETGVENLIKAIKNGRFERANQIKQETTNESIYKNNEVNSLNSEYENNLKLGYSSFNDKNYPNAIKYFSLVYNQNKDSKILYYRALSKDQIDDTYGALDDYNRLIEISNSGNNVENLATIYNNKAYKLVKLKRYGEALTFVYKALDLDKTLWYIWDTKGEILYNLDYYEYSINSMNEAINLKEDGNSFFFRGLSNIKLNNKEVGCRDLSKAGELGKSEAYTEIKKYCKK